MAILCWCGSGKEHSECHEGREQERRPTWGEVQLQHRIAFGYDVCLHPEAPASCGGGIINAHTVQRSRILEQLMDSTNHVLTFYPVDARDDYSVRGGPRRYPRLQRRGWREASTFRGFCSHHDSLTFRAIETQEYTGTSEQNFLIGYRAVCHELYQKTGAISTHEWAMENLDKGLPVPDQLVRQGFFQHHLVQVVAGRDDVAAAKSRYDRAMLVGDHAAYDALVVWFSGPLSIAGTGLFHPDVSLRGDVLQDLLDLSSPVEGLALGVVTVAGGGAVVLVWECAHKAIRAFIDSFLEVPRRRLPSVLAELVFAHLENVYFAPDWWSRRTVGQRERVEDLALTHLAAQEGVQPSGFRLVSWTISRVDGPRGAADAQEERP